MINEEQSIVLLKRSDVPAHCEFEIEFDKTLILNQDSEIGLLEISLPSSVRSNVFSIERQVSIDIQAFLTLIADHGRSWKPDPIDQTPFDSWNSIAISYTYPIEPVKTFEEFKKMLSDLNDKVFGCIENYLEHYGSKLGIKDKNLVQYNLARIDFDEDNHLIYQPGLIKILDINGSKEMKYDSDVHIKFDEDLSKLLGLDHIKYREYNERDDTHLLKPIKSSLKATDLGKFDQFYVHSNIVTESFVGETKSNILRVFSRNYSNDNLITYSFYNILFIPLRFREINSIKIQIFDSFGEVAIYDKGVLHLVLIIKPIR